MKKNILHIIAVTTLLFAFSGSLIAQTSIIEGYVKDGPSGEPVVGVTITIPGFAAITNSSGYYSFSEVTAGTTITVSLGAGSQRTFVVASGINQVNFWLNAVTDIKGNSYGSVDIGSQIWMTENLKTGRLKNNQAIAYVPNDATWASRSYPAYCWYNGDSVTYNYGPLYNFYAVSTGNLCPTGWHVPTYQEWLTLADYLGGGNIAGGKLKETGSVHWPDPNVGATNESGFTALPGGFRTGTYGAFANINYSGWWWTSTGSGSFCRYVTMYGSTSELFNWNGTDSETGFSVRCISNSFKPALTTTSINSTTINSAVSGGDITSEGTALVTARGVCWSTLNNPSISYSSHTNDGSGTGVFTSSLTGLSPNTTYYVRAYATNNIGTAYGKEISFTTLSVPIVTSDPISNVTAVSAFGGGDVTSDGGATIIERGICWSTSENPTTGDSKSLALAGTGSYTCNLANLDPDTLYYVRAFARNSVGTGYGTQEYFTTSAELGPISFPDLTYGTVSDVDGNNYRTIQIGSQVWMAENLKTTKYNDGTEIPNVKDNGEWCDLTTPAYCWYKNEPDIYKATFGALYNWFVVDEAKNVCPSGLHLPTNGDWSVLTTYLGGATVAGGKLKEADLIHWLYPNTGATNETGFTAIPGGAFIYDGDYAGTGDFNHIGELGFWWSEETGISDRMLRYNNSELDDFSAFPKQCGFSIRCVKAVELPVVTTTPISSISINTAQSGGNVTSDGGAPVTARGICWDNSTDPTIADNNLPDEGTGTGTFISLINDLVPGTIYYVRAYATNIVGTAYGEEMVFTTYRSDAITDIDGNYYNFIKIGTQIWLGENLRVTHFIDGNPVPYVTDNSEWSNLTTPGFSWYNNDEAAFKHEYGGLYNWFTVNQGNLCPVGWRVPTMADWDIMRDLLGGAATAGGALKETGTLHWQAPNEGATNSSLFTGLPGGYRSPDGTMRDLGIQGMFWTSTDGGEDHAYTKHLFNHNTELFHGWDEYKDGISVRCINDQLMVTNTSDAGNGSLRNAMEYANLNPGEDIITFNIPGTGPFTIQPQEALPEITDPVIIDGCTQPGTSYAASKLLIELDGTNAGEGSDGLKIKADNCTIKGLVINRFNGVGIFVDSYSEGNIIAGNYIGTDINGTEDLGNNGSGINLNIAARENRIGGSTSGERNIISGNNGDGIFLNESGGNTITGNYIGVDISGQLPLGNNQNGVEIAETGGNIIGGANPGERNVISSNGGDGIVCLYGAGGNKIMGNHIGADVSGKLPLGNTGDGVIIYYGSNNVIGGVGPGEGNVISFNQGKGISIHTGSNNLITKNSIYNNSKLGIDLEGGTEDDYGVTENGTLNVGPNNLQHYPVLQSITYDREEVNITGSLTGAINTKYNLQFFVNKVGDESGYGEGQVYLGSDSVATNSSGIATFDETFARSTSGELFTATATDPDENTSEFSKGIGGLESQILAENRFSFSVNELGVPNVLDNSDIDAVVASFQTWSDVETAIIDFTPDEGTTTPEKYAGNDDINLVTFADDLYDIPTGVLAIAAKTWHVDELSNTTEIIDVDIVFNPEFVNDPTYYLGIEGGTYDGYFDIQSVTTHEIGHVLGLLHSGVFNSTMWFQIGKGITVRDLEQDDKSWASYHYPIIDIESDYYYNDNFGSISGNITYGYDGQPVAGALILAINNASPNDTIHSYSDADGNYTVPGLIPGSYKIFIEPLDGDVRGRELWPGNISAYIGNNTIYLDYPGEFYNINDADVESDDDFDLVGVSAGLTEGGKDIITNLDKTPPTVELIKPTLLSGELVSTVSNFNIRFSELVDMETLNDESCYLSTSLNGTTEKVTGSFTKYQDYPTTILFDPVTDLKHNKTYTLHITTGVEDLRANKLEVDTLFDFNTVLLDETAPSINEVIPADDSINVFISSTVKLIFSEPMNMSSVEEGFALTWTEEGTTNTVDGSFSWRDYNKMVTFTPSGYLKEGTEYTISVSDAAADLSGNPMESSRSFTFTTVAVAPPEILYIGPGDEETGVTINTPIVVDFSEPINTSSVNSTTFKLMFGLDPSSSAEPIDGTYEFFNENSTIVFRPLSDLAINQDYTIILTEGIEDVSHPSSNLVYSETVFKTADKVSEPSISYLDLTYGVAGNAVTIAGAGFDPNPALNTVRFNGTEADITKAYLTSLEVVVPAEALSGPVTVTVNNKTSNSRNFDIYTEILDPAGYATANAPIGKKSTHDSDVTPEGAFAYVTNPEEGTVSVVDMNTLDVETIMIGEGKYPLMIDINPEGTKAYVTNFYSSDVSVIDLEPGDNYNTVIKNISVGIGPWGVAVTPDGQRVYVANYYSGSLSMIDADPTSGGYDHATANIPIGKDPTVTKANPDGALVLVVGDFGLTIVNSDPSNNDEYNTATVNITIGKKFTEATSTPDGAFAIVSTDDGYLLLIDLYPESGDYSDAVVANVKTGSDPSDIEARGDNAYVYLTDTDGDRILVYKIGAGGTGGTGSSMPSGIGMTLVYETEIPVGDAPQSLVIDADRLYVVDGDPSEPEVRRVTVFQFGLLSLSNGFSDLTKAIQGMIDAGYIKPANGKNIIRKLEDAQKYLDAGKTKNALNSLNAAGNMIKALMNSRQITVDQGNYLLNMLNLIIAEIIKDAKSDELDNYFFDLEQPVGEQIAETKLGVIYPNPTREAITINYEIAENDSGSEKVTIQIYDVIGRLVSNLVNENLAPGRYTATWNGYYDNGEMVTLGYYFIRFSAGNVREVKQIMMIR